jgi:IS5 family transposase
MMGRPQQAQSKLFYSGFNLDERVRKDNPLRAIKAAIDFDFVRPLVKPLYGLKGNQSIDPAMLLKLMFILFYEQVFSERALMERMSERLDWLWFCGLDIDSDIPDHSVISKARKRWGVEAFATFFARVLDQCVQANLVDGTLVHVDSSILAANADKNKLQTALRLAGQKFYDNLDAQQPAEQPNPPTSPQPELGSAVSATDPDARFTSKNGKKHFGYKDHRVVDDRCGIITATATTAANVNDDAMLMPLLEEHEENTGQAIEAVAADSAYGTAENYQKLQDQGVRPAIPHQRQQGVQGKFTRDCFGYNEAEDCYICPAGQKLYCTGTALNDGAHVAYRAGPGVCKACSLRSQCTTSKTGRTFARHVLQEAIDWADRLLYTHRGRYLLRRRRIRAEGSFADALRHGFKRARWRGLVNMRVQNLLIAAIQNIRKLMKYGPQRPWAGHLAVSMASVADVGPYLRGVRHHLRQKMGFLYRCLSHRSSEAAFGLQLQAEYR